MGEQDEKIKTEKEEKKIKKKVSQGYAKH